MKRESTASCYIVDNEKVLLLFHPKFQKWMPPGGHVEINETPQDACIREVKEETGLEVTLLSDDLFTVENANAITLARPIMCLLEKLPDHEHIDYIFLAKPTGGTLFQSNELRWFSVDELDIPLFDEVKKTILHLLQKEPVYG